MKTFRLLLATLLGGILLSLLSQVLTHASVNDFVIHDFAAKYELFSDTHGGRMRVMENIQLTFSDSNHGILRAIPKDYKKRPVYLDILSVKRDGQKESFSTYGQANNEVLKIGDANRTITGTHTYEITYEARNIVSFEADKDEWYWDVNGTQWSQPFEHVSAEVIFPNGWSDNDLPEASCYTGNEGSTAKDCAMLKTERGYTVTTLKAFGPGENLSLGIAAQKGLFSPREPVDWWKENVWQLIGLVAGMAGVLWMTSIWWRYGKDYKGRGTIIPEYEPPKGLSPTEVGLLMDYRVDGRDLTAAIVDLAIKGYIKIHDQENKILGLFKKHEFSLELAKDDFSKLATHEKDLLEAIFDPLAVGTVQPLATIRRTKMYEAATKIKRELKADLKKKHGLVEERPDTYQAWLIGIAVALFIAAIAIRPGWGWLAGMILAMISAIIYSGLMRRRSHAGVEAYEKVLGLKLYMDTAEKHRLEKLQSVDRPFAPPAQTVELFEKLLPFAIALGVEASWSKQFEGVYSQPPSWYSGNMSTFHMAYFASSLSSGVSAMNSSFTQSTTSSSSGSGGGGFSGGGGGGGGGGGW